MARTPTDPSGSVVKLTITLSPRHRDQLDDIAKRRDWSRGQVISNMLDRVVEKAPSPASAAPAAQTPASTAPRAARKAPAPRKAASGRAVKTPTKSRGGQVVPIPKGSTRQRGRR